MKRSIFKIWLLAVELRQRNKYLHPIALGGPDWNASHLWWRFYLVEKAAGKWTLGHRLKQTYKILFRSRLPLDVRARKLRCVWSDRPLDAQKRGPFRAVKAA